MKHLLIAFTLLLSSCVTTPLPTLNDYKNLEPKDIFKFGADAKDANVIIARDDGFLGSAASLFVFIDGEKVARIYGGYKVNLKLSPGTHIFGLASPYENDPKPFVEVESEVKGELSIYRVSIIHGQPAQINKTTIIK